MRIRKNINAMTGYVPGEQPCGENVVKLNTNENPYPPSPRVMERLSAITAESLRRYPDPVCCDLRECLAKMHDVQPDRILVGNGSDEVLALCLRAFVERDAQVGFFDPSYSLYPVLAKIEDIKTNPVPLTDDFQWDMPKDYSASLFFLAYPNAPTGTVYDKDIIRTFCGSFSGVVLIDEAYADFAADNCMDLVDEFDNVLVSRTLSKSYSLAGLRLGYVVGSRPLIEALYKIKDSYNVNALTQTLGLAALQDQPYHEETVQKVIRTRERIAAELQEIGFEMQPSSANFLWIKPTHTDAETIFLRLKEQQIFVRYFPGDKTGQYLRVSVGTDEQMERFISAVRSI